MAVLQKIRELFVPPAEFLPEIIIPAPADVYEIRPLTELHLWEVLTLNLRCFKEGENYTKHTFSYLLNEPNCLSYRIVTSAEQMAGYIFIMINEEGTGHITTLGVAPEHRRRGLANRLIAHCEKMLNKRNVSTVMLEVRVSNTAAQTLYQTFGYSVVQRLVTYYNNGEDGFLMVKSL